MQKLRQQNLPFRTWGGKRRDAGRKPSARRAGVPHLSRPLHCERHPVHITLRAGRFSILRKQLVFLELRAALSKTARSWFRIVHYSVQTNHLHLLVEALDKESLSRGVAGTAVRLARAVNRVLGRRGTVFSDRYHARTLRTPREVRNGIVYVLMNRRKHAPRARGFDACSSAALFDGWKVPPASGPPRRWLADDSPIRPAESWLARVGWKRHGLISTSERPKAAL